jgi:hypothetical protein
MANITLGARAIKETQAANDSAFQDRTYATGLIAFDWRFARHWTLAGSYVYSWQE